MESQAAPIIFALIYLMIIDEFNPNAPKKFVLTQGRSRQTHLLQVSKPYQTSLPTCLWNQTHSAPDALDFFGAAGVEKARPFNKESPPPEPRINHPTKHHAG